MLIRKISLKNFLSYGDICQEIELAPLNVIIGSNGSGKSNFLDVIDLLRHAPGQISKPVRESGGINEWLNKNQNSPAGKTAAVEVGIDLKGHPVLEYYLLIGENANQFEIIQEKIDVIVELDTVVRSDKYSYRIGEVTKVWSVGEKKLLATGVISPSKSGLAQLRDPSQYPEITFIAEQFEKISFFREWTFGRKSPAHQPQRADLPSEWLEPDGSNLALVLNRIRQDITAKKRLLEALQELYEGIEDYDVQVHGGYVETFFHEGGQKIPATRLSDGTLRYLSLLAILLHPAPPPLVCIEEPELGLHPDLLPTVADLLKDASTRMQLIVTTHSDILVDAMTDTPEAILICEKISDGSCLRRLDAEQLKPWLEKYRLGELWLSGEIGGKRW